jgi:hypothetical protein
MQSELLATANDSFHMLRDIVWLWDGGHETDTRVTSFSLGGQTLGIAGLLFTTYVYFTIYFQFFNNASSS